MKFSLIVFATVAVVLASAETGPVVNAFKKPSLQNWLQHRIEQRLGIDPEVNMDARQLIESKGYNFEEHKVTTQDGYILTVHRVSKGPRRRDANAPVFLVQHGLLCDSTFWLLNLVDQDLPFMLADAGVGKSFFLSNVRI